MIESISNTRVNINIELKDYPHGKLYKLHFWLDGFSEKSEIQDYIDEQFKLDIINGDIEGIDENLIHRAYIDRVIYTNDMSIKEGFNNVIFDSCITIIPDNKSKNNKNQKQQKQQNTKPKNIVLHEISDDDLKSLKDKIDVEFLKRKHFLSDDEYNFYKINENYIELENVKEMYKKYKGDAFKIKKMNIRNILKSKNLLFN